jgi:ribosome-dependent ATPase
VLDRDQTTESRAYIDAFAGSTYFVQRPPLNNQDELISRLKSAELAFTVEIPPDFGVKINRKQQVDVAITVDAANVFRAETIMNYAEGVHDRFLENLSGVSQSDKQPLAQIRTRFRYNQAFRSVDALVPSTIGLMLIFIPAILTALAVVREKELGTITNLYVTPVKKIEFLLGKQLPYVLIALINLAVMVIMAVTIFDLPLKGSFVGLVLGAIIYVFATTAIGLLSSCVTNSQTAAVFGTAVGTMIPATQFSGMLQPVAALSGSGYFIGTIFPTTYFLNIAVGAFTKALSFSELLPFIGATLIFWPVLLVVSALLLPKQEA